MTPEERAADVIRNSTGPMPLTDRVLIALWFASVAAAAALLHAAGPGLDVALAVWLKYR